VETVLFNGVNITLWDVGKCHLNQYFLNVLTQFNTVGGCDKIRPLWRHYYQNTQGVIFVVDSNDRDRIEEAGQELRRLLAEEELRGAKVLIFANKQDLPGAMTVDEISDRIALRELTNLPTSPLMAIFPCSALTRETLDEGMTWLTTAIAQPPGSDSDHMSPPPPPPAPGVVSNLTPQQEEAKRHEELLIDWLERQDGDDDTFLAKLLDYTLESWDHYTHLRIAWVYLSKYGRREGLEKIFAGIKAFIENSPRTVRASGRGTTFHETMVCSIIGVLCCVVLCCVVLCCVVLCCVVLCFM
jgi:GTPase SAR1 family protein